MTCQFADSPLLPERYHRFAKFLVVGAVNTAVGYAVFAALVFLLERPVLALFLTTLFSIVFNFRTSGRFVFDSSDDRLLLRFAIVHCVAFGLNTLGLKLLIHAGLSPYLAQALWIIPHAIGLYFAQLYLVFRSQDKYDTGKRVA